MLNKTIAAPHERGGLFSLFPITMPTASATKTAISTTGAIMDGTVNYWSVYASKLLQLLINGQASTRPAQNTIRHKNLSLSLIVAGVQRVYTGWTPFMMAYVPSAALTGYAKSQMHSLLPHLYNTMQINPSDDTKDIIETAAAVSLVSLVTVPLERLNTQAIRAKQQGSWGGYLNLAKALIAKEGARALLKGAIPQIARDVGFFGLVLNNKSDTPKDVIVGSVKAGVMTYSFDGVRNTMQAHQGPMTLLRGTQLFFSEPPKDAPKLPASLARYIPSKHLRVVNYAFPYVLGMTIRSGMMLIAVPPYLLASKLFNTKQS